MKIIYISSLISKEKLNYIINNSKNKPLQSIQKYHRLLCTGFVKNNVSVKAISAIPMSRQIMDKLFWKERSETEDGINYKYLPFVNIKYLRQLCIFIFTLFYIIRECIFNRKEKCLICDILNTTITYTALTICKIFHVKCIAIVTDLPEDMGEKENLNKKINRKLQNTFDGYIFLTEAMNEVINVNNKPHIVIEGIADVNMKTVNNNVNNKYKNKVCLYAGGLYEKYGIKVLIEAFMRIKNDNIELHLYGTGDLEDYIKNIKDTRIKYFGVATNEIIVQEELKATLLINPRFTNQEYTKYSFPSKNMEYMASGTPLLTTRLPGMPKEYYEYIYTFDEESINSYMNKLSEVLNYKIIELNNKGKEAQKFVIKEKNNIVQAKKILEGIILI